jgi:hypothetical protein
MIDFLEPFNQVVKVLAIFFNLLYRLDFFFQINLKKPLSTFTYLYIYIYIYIIVLFVLFGTFVLRKYRSPLVPLVWHRCLYKWPVA